MTKKTNLYFETFRDCGNAVSLVFIFKGDLTWRIKKKRTRR